MKVRSNGPSPSRTISSESVDLPGQLEFCAYTIPLGDSMRIFISHSHKDKPLASALHVLLTNTFKDALTIYYSTDDAPDGGIRAGGTWLDWINTAVRHTDVCIVILTEDSADAAWVTWETGAVTGVAIGSETASDRTAPTIRVVPLMFGLNIDRVPAPLELQQAVRGDQATGVRKLLFALQELMQQRDEGSAAGSLDAADQTVSTFVEAVKAIMERRMREYPLRLQASDRSAIHLLNCRHGETLQPRDGEIADGVRLQCGSFTGDVHQRWLLYQVDIDTYRITTPDGTKCISIENDSSRAGAAVILWDYVGHASQHWKLTRAFVCVWLLSTVSLVNVFSKCLMSSEAAGNNIVQAKRQNVTNEDWWILLQGQL